jgi:hypothetical protein
VKKTDVPTVFSRPHDGGLTFLCERCGNVHSHGSEPGPRVSHCAHDSWKFGERYENYFLVEMLPEPGHLTEEDSTSLLQLARIAHRLTRSMRLYLEIADVDPLGPAYSRLVQAEEALLPLADVLLERKNPFEALLKPWLTAEED